MNKPNDNNQQNDENSEGRSNPLETIVSPHDNDIKRMRADSGTIKDDSKLVCFMYILGRDYLSLGKIEEIMMNMKNEKIEYTYTNGWLAQYAQDVANRLKSG